MDKKSSKAPMSKRQAMREERAKKQRQQRIITVVAIAAVALVVVGLIIVPSIQSSNAPVGEFTRITSAPKAQVDGTRMGDANAKVKIEIFEDFKCSACQSYGAYIEPQVIAEIIQTGKAYYIFYQYPFLDDRSASKDSDNAANAALCAAAQNRFWDYKEMLFANLNYVESEFSDKRLSAFAESLGLDTEAFNACLDDRQYQDQINQDLALGQQMGVTGTPSVFVNGKDVSPGKVPTFEQILQAVEEAASTAGG
jgi:protein-disulfide isomerase